MTSNNKQNNYTSTISSDLHSVCCVVIARHYLLWSEPLAQTWIDVLHLLSFLMRRPSFNDWLNLIKCFHPCVLITHLSSRIWVVHYFCFLCVLHLVLYIHHFCSINLTEVQSLVVFFHAICAIFLLRSTFLGDLQYLYLAAHKILQCNFSLVDSCDWNLRH